MFNITDIKLYIIGNDNVNTPEFNHIGIKYEIINVNSTSNIRFLSDNNLSGIQLYNLLAHYNAAKYILKSDCEFGIICNNITLKDINIKSLLSKYNFDYNQNEPICINCIYESNDHLCNLNEYLINSCKTFNESLYIINKHFAQIILDNFLPIQLPFDEYIKHIIDKYTINLFYTSPSLHYEQTNISLLQQTPVINKCNDNGIIRYHKYIENNFGDMLNTYYLLKYETITNIMYEQNQNSTHIIMIGSIMHSALQNSIIMGGGVIKEKTYFDDPLITLLVRGPLTKQIYNRLGYYCPSNYGDPAIILSDIYNKQLSKKYKYGIIPHNTDYKYIKQHFNVDNNIIINLNTSLEQIEPTIDLILKCEYIFSSSLHGLIVAHAYGIKAIWIQSHKKLYGDSIKFKDYYSSLELIPPTPLVLDNHLLTNYTDIIETFPNPTLDIINKLKNNVKQIPFYNKLCK